MNRAIRKNQTTEVVNANVHRVTRLLQTFIDQMEALNRHRGKVGHAMVVGNVNVNDGGQAIVGPVTQADPKSASGERAPAEKDATKIE
jgi:hypothetical protein